jgi:hypothetical protein
MIHLSNLHEILAQYISMYNKDPPKGNAIQGIEDPKYNKYLRVDKKQNNWS